MAAMEMPRWLFECMPMPRLKVAQIRPRSWQARSPPQAWWSERMTSTARASTAGAMSSPPVTHIMVSTSWSGGSTPPFTFSAVKPKRSTNWSASLTIWSGEPTAPQPSSPAYLKKRYALNATRSRTGPPSRSHTRLPVARPIRSRQATSIAPEIAGEPSRRANRWTSDGRCPTTTCRARSSSRGVTASGPYVSLRPVRPSSVRRRRMVRRKYGAWTPQEFLSGGSGTATGMASRAVIRTGASLRRGRLLGLRPGSSPRGLHRVRPRHLIGGRPGGRAAHIALHPGHDPACDIEAVAGPAVPEKEVALAGIPHELRRGLARGHQPDEQFLALPDRAAVVGLAVEEQRRGGDALHVADRGEAAVDLALGGEVALHLPRDEPHPDIGRPMERF